MSRSIKADSLSPEAYNRFKALSKEYPHQRAAARAVVEAGLDALAPKPKPKPTHRFSEHGAELTMGADVTTPEGQTTPEALREASGDA